MIETKALLLALGSCWLNPLVVLAYLLFAGNFPDHRGQNLLASQPETNCTRLFVAPYLILAPLIYAAAITSMWLVVHSINPRIELIEMFSPASSWLTYLGFAVAGVCLAVCFSKSGMEGNVMGFIFFPLFAVSICSLAIAHTSWLIHGVFN